LEILEKRITDEFITDFARAISEPRFKRYYRIYPGADGKPEDRDKVDAVAIYMWNLAHASPFTCRSTLPR
jgi:hypothetical protein